MQTVPLAVSLADINETLVKRHLAFLFGWQDVAQRYRRSKVGAFWLTINMGVYIGSIGAIFSALFNSSMKEYLPHLCAGILVWTFASHVISEGCTAFINSRGIILQVRMPLFTHIVRMWWRNAIILAHNIVILPLVLVYFGQNPFPAVLFAPLGFIVLSINVLWMALALAVLCTRYRDMTQIVQNILQVLFYATPIMWFPSRLPEGPTRSILEWNPFFHLIAIVRDPLLGTAPTLLNWQVSIAIAVVGWVFALLFFGRYRSRIAYWL